MDELDGSLGIVLSELEKLGVVVLRTFKRCRLAVLDLSSGFNRGSTHPLERFLDLRGAVFGRRAKRLRSIQLGGAGWPCSRGFGCRFQHGTHPLGVPAADFRTRDAWTRIGCLLDHSGGTAFRSTNAIV